MMNSLHHIDSKVFTLKFEYMIFVSEKSESQYVRINLKILNYNRTKFFVKYLEYEILIVVLIITKNFISSLLYR